MKTTLIISSDHHIGGTTALCPLAVELPDGGFYRASKIQKYIKNHWEEFTRRALAQAEGGRLINIFNGDIYDGDHHDTTQIVTRNEATMLGMAYPVLSPIIEPADKVYVIAGTPSHAGRGHKLERWFADDVGAEFRRWLYLEVGGVTFDIAHHGSMGRVPWGKNAAERLAELAIFQSGETGHPPPDFVFRAHNHRWVDSYDRYRTRGICLGAWQFPTEYVDIIQPGATAQLGGVIMTIENGRMTYFEKFNPKPPKSKPEKVIYD